MNATIRRWPAWSGYAAAGWTVPYLALATAWVLGSTFAYPWRKPDGEFFGGESAVGVQGWLILPLGVAGVAAALIARRDANLAGPLRRVLVRLALGASFALAAVQSFGLAIGLVGSIAVGDLPNPLGTATQLYGLLGAILYGAAATAWHRRTRGRCPRCGDRHSDLDGVAMDYPPASPAPRRIRLIAYVALLGIVPWAAVKLWWTWGGDALGMTATEWDESAKTTTSALTRFLDSLGIDITVLAALAGVLLVAALLQAWSQSLPRWLPWRIPRPLLLVPAWVGAVSLTLYGYPLIVAASLMLTGVLDVPADTGAFTATGSALAVLFGGTTFAGLGTALGLGALSYQQRTRPRCVST